MLIPVRECAKVFAAADALAGLAAAYTLAANAVAGFTVADFFAGFAAKEL